METKHNHEQRQSRRRCNSFDRRLGTAFSNPISVHEQGLDLVVDWSPSGRDALNSNRKHEEKREKTGFVLKSNRSGYPTHIKESILKTF